MMSPRSQKLWRVRQLPNSTSIWPDTPPLLQRLYQLRGVQSSDQINHQLDVLPAFKAMKNITQAADLLTQMVCEQKRVLIIGDYDTDGATSTAVAVRALRAFGLTSVDFLLPNRMVEGYGLSPALVERAQAFSPDCIITVDNGISSFDGVKAARKLGWQVLITDHHLAGKCVPDDCVIVNPNQPGDMFQSKCLAGVGVIFYVMAALRAHLQAQNYFEKNSIACPAMSQWLDLVALGTIADVVPLDHTNRILVQQGLRRIRAAKVCPGILALLKVAGRDPMRCVAQDFGFAVGPRLNAAGRIDDMQIGVRCLLADDMSSATAMAQSLDEINQSRRLQQADMQNQADKFMQTHQIQKNPPPGICLYDAAWHPGIVGLVASKIKEKTYRPSIAFAKGDHGMLKGSARSIPGVHIRDSLVAVATAQPQLLSQYGGHAMAAGLSIYEKDFEAFTACWQSVLKPLLTPEILSEVAYHDGTLMPDELNLVTAHQLQESTPWGQGFLEPVFEGHFEILGQRWLKEKHWRVDLRDPRSGEQYQGIWFFATWQADVLSECDTLTLFYRLSVNCYNQCERLQLMIEDVQALKTDDKRPMSLKKEIKEIS